MNPQPNLKEKQQQWLALWRDWGKPCLGTGVSFSPLLGGEHEGHIGSSEIAIRFAGDPYEYADFVLQPFKVLAGDEDISVLVAELAGLTSEDGCLVMMFREFWWEAMTNVAAMVMFAHSEAAMACRDVEAMWALDKAVAAERVATLEAMLLDEQMHPAIFGTRAKRPRL